jgi:hypothetical protein
MAKLSGIFGKASGKLGSVVLAINHGEQIAREYNGKPTNPKSQAQTESRARLKIMSQLSAVMAGDIAIQRVGTMSGRNIFVRQNYPLTYIDNGAANIDLDRVQLTKSIVGLPSFAADRTDGQYINVALTADARGDISRVVYVAYAKQTDQSLRKLGSTVATESGINGTFPAALPYTANAVVVLCYAIRDVSVKAQVVFGNMIAPSSEEVAKLLTSRVLSVRDVAVTETIGLQMAVGENTNESESVERASVALYAIGNGTVNGTGRFVVGSRVTVRATAGENAEFAGWYDAAQGGNLVSSDATYGFTLTENVSLYAKFVGSPVTLTVQSEDNTHGTVSGGGTFEAGESTTIHATPASGYSFDGWYDGATKVSTQADYTLVVNTNKTLVAHFAEVVGMTLSISGGDRQITESNAGTVEAGTSITPTATFAAGAWILNGITIDGSNDDQAGWIAQGNTYTRREPLTMNTNHSIVFTWSSAD